MTIQDTGLDPSFLADLALKHILSLRAFTLSDISERLKRPTSVVDAVLEILQRDNLIEVRGASDYARYSYRFAINGLGQSRAPELLDMCRYVGPAPGSCRTITSSGTCAKRSV
jgi:hypothetical protein